MFSPSAIDLYVIICVQQCVFLNLFCTNRCTGELKDPSKAIPKGTLFAVMFTFLSYLILIILVGGSCDR